MALKLSAECLAAITSNAEAAYPEEGCGLILGRDGLEAGDRQGLILYPAPNRHRAGQRLDSFSLAPEDFLAAEAAAEAEGLEIVGIYHSHPDHPAFPSPRDLARAWPFYSYVIVNVVGGRTGGRAGELASFRLADDRRHFNPEPVTPETVASETLTSEHVASGTLTPEALTSETLAPEPVTPEAPADPPKGDR
jgi:proteasome lid subunit RPN8/RPN11